MVQDYSLLICNCLALFKISNLYKGLLNCYFNFGLTKIEFAISYLNIQFSPFQTISNNHTNQKPAARLEARVIPRISDIGDNLLTFFIYH